MLSLGQREHRLSSADRVFIKARIEYAKKKDKKALIQFVKDETVPRDDVYKSHTVHVPSGEPPTSTSRPRAKRKQGIVRPITQGKLLRAGGPFNVSRKAFSKQPIVIGDCRSQGTYLNLSTLLSRCLGNLCLLPKDPFLLPRRQQRQPFCPRHPKSQMSNCTERNLPSRDRRERCRCRRMTLWYLSRRTKMVGGWSRKTTTKVGLPITTLSWHPRSRERHLLRLHHHRPAVFLRRLLPNLHRQLFPR